jgi:LacI family transcriptional regulator
LANATPHKLNLGQIAAQAKVPITSVMQIVLGLGKTIDSAEFTRVKQVLEQLDTVILSPNQSSVGVKHIGVVVQSPSKILNMDYQGVILDTLLNEFDPKRYLLVLYFYVDGDLANVDEFIEHIDGMIMIGGVTSQAAEKCRAIGRPYVLIDPGDREMDERNAIILINNEIAIHDLMQHLMALGHRKIAMVTGQLLHGVARERLAAYQAVLQAKQLPQNPDWVVESRWTEESGYACGKYLMGLEDRPTAILAANDLNALGVVRAIHEFGLEVGKDISVTGFDDLPMSSEDYLQLTTIRQPLRAMGRMAMELISRLVNGETLSENVIVIPTELVVRKSTGTAPTS